MAITYSVLYSTTTAATDATAAVLLCIQNENDDVYKIAIFQPNLFGYPVEKKK